MRMILSAIALMIAIIGRAGAEDLPHLNLDPICHGIAAHASAPGEAGGPDLSFTQCVDQELRVRSDLLKDWATFSLGSQRQCIGEASDGGLASYTDLLTCLQIARDAERMHLQDK